jgi:hypothetical protein
MFNELFKFDSDTKQEFLNSKPSGTAKSNYFVLKLADDYEVMMQKPIYDLSIAELKEMLATQYRNSTIGVIAKNVSILRNYINFCIDKNLVIHNENRLMSFTRKELKQFVSQQALEYKYITREELAKYQNMLANEQDVAILEALYNGIRGRASKDGTLEELLNLQIDRFSEDFERNVLKLEKNNGQVRYIQISDKTKNILLEAMDQQEYVANNGEESLTVRGGIRKSVINSLGNLVFRVPGKKKREKLTSLLIQSRMQRIQEWCSNRFITVNSLYMSGIISMAKDIHSKNGKITVKDYLAICERFDYGSDNPEKYYTALKTIVEQYL